MWYLNIWRIRNFKIYGTKIWKVFFGDCRFTKAFSYRVFKQQRSLNNCFPAHCTKWKAFWKPLRICSIKRQGLKRSVGEPFFFIVRLGYTYSTICTIMQWSRFSPSEISASYTLSISLKYVPALSIPPPLVHKNSHLPPP